MKTKEQELGLIGLQEMSNSEKNEIDGGRLYPWNDEVDTLGIAIF
jgi:hypothetical protein